MLLSSWLLFLSIRLQLYIFTEKAVEGANSKVYSEKKKVADYIYCHIKSLDRAAPDLIRCPVSSSRAVEDPGNNRGEEKR